MIFIILLFVYKEIEKRKRDFNPIRTFKSIFLIKFNIKFKKKLENIKKMRLIMIN